MSSESKILLDAAKKKDPEASYKVALGLMKGQYGLKRFPEKAPEYFKIAADSGNIDAINRYADIQMKGKKYDEAIKYYKIGIQKKSTYSIISYGKYIQELKHDDGKATKYFKYAAELNDPEGMYLYSSSLYQKGQNNEAKKLLRKSADLGYYESLHLLSIILKEEEEKNKNDINNQTEGEEEAESYLIEEQYRSEKKKYQEAELKEKIRLANEENDAEAMIWLTEKYSKEPIRKNRLLAIPYYEKLAHLKDFNSIKHLQVLYKCGMDVDMDIRKYFKYTKMLADLDDVDSALKVSELYLNGEGCKANKEQSIAYKDKAAELKLKSFKSKLNSIANTRKELKTKGKSKSPETKKFEIKTFSEAYKFALQLLNGEIYNQNFEKGYSLLHILANMKFKVALNEILNIMLRSEEMAPNPNEAEIVKFLKLKKDDSYVLDLAHIFLNGDLDKLNVSQDGPVISFFKQFAIDKNDEKLFIKFAKGYNEGKPPLEKDPDQYLAFVKRLAELNNPLAIDKLKFIYQKEAQNSPNAEPSEEDLERAKFIRMAKLQDLKRLKDRADSTDGSNAFAMINYAKTLIEGDDYIEPNVEEGIKYLKKAAEQCKNSTAMFELGQLYENGQKVEKNMDEAIQYYSLGQKTGNNQCSFNLVKCLLKANKGIEACEAIQNSGDADFTNKLFNKMLYEWKYDPNEIVSLLKVAADSGDVDSMKILSKYLINGRNVNHNPDEANVYLNMYNKSINK